MSKRERLRETVSLIIGRIRDRWRRQREEAHSDPEEEALLVQARKAIKKRYGRRKAKEILRPPPLVIFFPDEFDVRGINGVVLFGKGTARYEPGGIDKGDQPYPFKRTIRLNDRDDSSRGIMIFIHDPNPRYPSESHEPTISRVGMEFFFTPGTQPSHPWPCHMPIVVAPNCFIYQDRDGSQTKTDSNQLCIVSSIMIGVLPDIELEKTNYIFPSPCIDQFLFVTA